MLHGKEVRQQCCLLNIGHKHYKINKMKDSVWQSVAGRLGCQDSELLVANSGIAGLANVNKLVLNTCGIINM